MKYSKVQKQHHEEMEKASLEANRYRARSVVVGTAFGGTVEVAMRSNDGSYLWATLQPVEVTELIHQLAANIGCHINLQPRQDFSSWRNWKVSDHEKQRLNGHPPFHYLSEDKFLKTGVNALLPEQQPDFSKKELDHAMATQENIDRRNIERSATPT